MEETLSKRFLCPRAQQKLYLAGKFNYLASFEITQYKDAKIDLERLDQLERARKYYAANKEKVNAYKNQRAECKVCGGSFTRCNKTHHNLTNKHQAALLVVEGP